MLKKFLNYLGWWMLILSASVGVTFIAPVIWHDPITRGFTLLLIWFGAAVTFILWGGKR